MKKVLALMLALVMAVSLASCGGGGETKNQTEATESAKATKEDLLKEAQKMTWYDINDTMANNELRAKQEICAKPIIVKCKVKDIAEDYALLGQNMDGNVYARIKAYLPNDELLSINKDDMITIVGKVSDWEKTTGDEFGDYNFIMPIAYIK